MTTISIIIPVQSTENITHLNTTLDSIKTTIGLDDYSITFVGKLPDKFFYSPQSRTKFNYISSTGTLGERKNEGARYAIQKLNAKMLVFIDSHMNFFQKESANWGITLLDFITQYPDSIVAPPLSEYETPRGVAFGTLPSRTEDAQSMILVGKVQSKNDLKYKYSNNSYEVPGICGGFHVMSPKTYHDSIIGYTPTFGIEDLEFSMRMWTLGKTILLYTDLLVGHYWRSDIPNWDKEKSINWGMSMLLFTFLNFDDENITRRLYEKDITASQDKLQSWNQATTYYWRQIREQLKRKRVRTAEQYYAKFNINNNPRPL